MVFVTALPLQSRSGSASAAMPVDNAQGYTEITAQVLTDATWPTIVDGRTITFNAACSFDGGTTFPWTVGPFIVGPPTMGKGGANPSFSFSIPPSIDHFQASYAVSSGSLTFGLAIEPR